MITSSSTDTTAPKPDCGNAGLNWSEEGWFVPVYDCALESPIRPKDHITVLRHFLPSKSSPLQANGDGLQSVYLAEVRRGTRESRTGIGIGLVWTERSD